MKYRANTTDAKNGCETGPKWLRNGAKMGKKQGEKKAKKREVGRVANYCFVF